MSYDPNSAGGGVVINNNLNVSGVTVQISGQTVIAEISGQTVNIQGGVNVSGQVVWLASGRNPVQLFALDLSGNTLNALAVDTSGSHRLQVDAVTNVTLSGANFNISGETVRITALEVSGTFPNVYVTQSGKAVSGIPHRLVVAFSGDTAIAKISGETVVTSISGNVVSTSGGVVKISGETVSIVSGAGVRISGETLVITSGTGVRISGESVRISPESGRATAELKAYDLSGLAWNPLAVDVSGGNALRIAGSFTADVSGQPVNVSGSFVFISGQPVSVSGNVVSTSGGVAKISGEVVRISAESGRASAQLKAYDLSGLAWNDLAVDVSGGNALRVAGSFSADISGQVVSTSGGVVKISGEVVQISGQVVSTSGGVSKISGEVVRISAESGRASAQLKAYDLSGLAWNDLAVDVSGGNALRIAGTFSADISGQVVSTSGGVVKISGEVVRISQESGRAKAELFAYDLSGTQFSNLIIDNSGTFGRLVVSVSGQSVVVISGTGVRISGETISVTSGIGVRISGEVVSTSGGAAKISGEVVRISAESGRASAHLKAYDLSGLAWNDLTVDVSGGNALRIAGSFSADISGQVVSTSGGVVKISGEVVRISAESGRAAAQLFAYDLSGTQFSNLIIDNSGTFGRLVVSVSGQPVNIISGAGVRVSGETVSVTSGTGVRISGEVVSTSGGAAKISGEVVRISNESGRATAQLHAYDLSGLAWNPVAVDNSGSNVLRVNASVTANISGQTVATWPESGRNAVYITNQSGNVAAALTDGGAQIVTVSGNVVNVVSGTGVRVSGESVRISTESGRARAELFAYDLSGAQFSNLVIDNSGTFGRLVVSVSGQSVSVISGTGVRVSGETVSVTSGTGVRVSGEVVNISGMVVSTSGGVVKISGETISVVSGTGVRVSGETVSVTSGTGVRVSGETIQLTSGAGVRISGEVVSISNLSGRANSQLFAYDLSGASWKELTVARSGSNTLQVQTQFVNPLTYVFNGVQDIRSGMYMFLCFNSGVQGTMEMKALYMSYVNPLITSGGTNVPVFELWRITANSGGGSGQNFVRMDPGDTTSGIAVQLNINNLSGAGGTDKLFQWSLGLTVSGAVTNVSSASNVNLPQHIQHMNAMMNGINWIPSQSREMKQPTIRSGFGLAIRQSVNAGYTQIVSGQVFITAVFNVYNSGIIQTY